MQLTMGYFDTDYLKCHFIRFSTKHDLKYYLVKPGNITSLQSFCFWLANDGDGDEKVSHLMRMMLSNQTCGQLVFFEEDSVGDPQL